MPRLSPNLKNISSKEEEEEEEIKITHRTFCFIDRTVHELEAECGIISRTALIINRYRNGRLRAK